MNYIAFKDLDLNTTIFVRADLVRALVGNPESPGSYVIVEGAQQPIRVIDEVEELASLLESHVPNFKIIYYS